MVSLAIGALFGTGAALVYKVAMGIGCRSFHLIAVERAVMFALFAVCSVRLSWYEFNFPVFLISVLAGTVIIVARWAILVALTIGKASTCYVIWNLSIALPVVFSIFIWGEIPNIPQTIGICFVPLGIFWMRETESAAASGTGAAAAGSIMPDSRRRRVWLLLMLLCFLLEGVFALCFKMIKELDLEDSQLSFLLLYNAVAMIGAVAMLLKSRSLPQGKELKIGLLTGLLIGISSIFWLRAIIQLEGIVFFPVATVCAILMLALSSQLIWRERISWIQRLGIAVAIAAILLISM